MIGNVSTAWLREVAPLSKPFFAYIGVKAAHEPFTPAPWYTEHWDDAWPDHEPRPANYNCSLSARSRHHGCIRTAPLLTEAAASVITGSFKNRWRTLLSLDDLVAAAYEVCQGAGVVDRTYFISTSDHGFQSRDEGSKTGYYNYADIDDDFISIHHYLKWYKFGMTRLFDNLSLEIRNGRKTREEALKIIKERGDDTPYEDIEKFCNYVKITKDEFFNIIETFRNLDIWKKDNNVWQIKNFIIKDWNWN